MTLLLIVSFSMAVVVVSTVAKRLGEAFLSDPFVAFVDVFPGQSIDARLLEAEGFSCQLDSQPSPADINEYCSWDLLTGPFSHVGVIIWDGTVMRLGLTIRENLLTVDDLVLLWGNSEIFINRDRALVRWADPGVIRTGWSHKGRLTPFQTLSAISFSTGT